MHGFADEKPTNGRPQMVLHFGANQMLCEGEEHGGEYYSSTDGSWQSAEKRTDINFDNLVLFRQSIHGIFSYSKRLAFKRMPKVLFKLFVAV